MRAKLSFGPLGGDWREVWECPTCGCQMALGDRLDSQMHSAIPPRCSMGHARAEMEQKLVHAFDQDQGAR